MVIKRSEFKILEEIVEKCGVVNPTLKIKNLSKNLWQNMRNEYRSNIKLESNYVISLAILKCMCYDVLVP